MYKIRYFRSFSELPELYAPLINRAVNQSFFYDPAWFELLVVHDFDDEDELRIYVVEDVSSEQPLLLVPMRYTLLDGAAPYAQTLSSIRHSENYAVLCLMFESTETEEQILILTTLFKHLKSASTIDFPARFDMLRLSPVEVGSTLENTVRKALQKSGYWVQGYTNSFNRYEHTEGMNHEKYLEQRSANFRYNIRRRERNLQNNYKVEFKLYRDNENLPQGIAEYIAVTESSWKSLFSMITDGMLDLIQLAANKNCLRLGILLLNNNAVAAQLWIVSGGAAICARLAYDKTYKKQAVGVVLTNFMIAHLLDQDHINKLDFGYGEEEYKAAWMKDYRDYAGYIAFNPTTMRGLFFGIKHILGRPLKRCIKRSYYLLKPSSSKAPVN